MYQAKCTNCGASLSVQQGDKTCVCQYCQTTNIVENALALGKVEVDVTKDIQTLRSNLTTFAQQNSIDEILRVSQKLLDWIPQDFVARYFFAYAKQQQNQPRFMYEFYQSPPTYTKDEWIVVFNHIKIHSELRDRQRVLSLLANKDESLKREYEDKYKIRERMEENYANIPRDVFICFSSYDESIAQEVLETLERDGHSCWISTRNLRPNDADNYWNNIENAIQKASLFIVISSEEAMRSKDVQQEVELAIKHQKKRFEIKIDSSKHTSLFKYAFDGIKWLDYQGLNRAKLLTERVFTELGQSKGIIKPKKKFKDISLPSQSITKVNESKRQLFGFKQSTLLLATLLITTILIVSFNSLNNNSDMLADEEPQLIDEVIPEVIVNIDQPLERVPSPIISIDSEIQYFTFPFSNTYKVAKGFPFVLPDIKLESEDYDNLRYFINGQEVESFASVRSVPINDQNGRIIFIVRDSFNQLSNEVIINYSVIDEIIIPKFSFLNNENVIHTDVMRIRASKDGYYLASIITKESPLLRTRGDFKPGQKFSNLSFISNDFRLVWSKSYSFDEFVLKDFIMMENNDLLLIGHENESNYCSNVLSDGKNATAKLLNELGEELKVVNSYSDACDNSFFGALEINNKILLLSQGLIDDENVLYPQFYSEIYSKNLSESLFQNTLSDLNSDYIFAYRSRSANLFTNGQVASKNFLPATMNDGYFIIHNQLFQIGQDSRIKKINYARSLDVQSHQLNIEDDVFKVIYENKICSDYYLQNKSYEALHLNLEHIVFAFNSVVLELQDGCFTVPLGSPGFREILEYTEIGSYLFFMNSQPTNSNDVIREIFFKDQLIYHISQVPPALIGRNENGYLIYTGNSIYRLNRQLELEGEPISYTNFSSRLDEILNSFSDSRLIFNRVDVVVYETFSATNSLLITESKPVLFNSNWEIIIPSRNLIDERMEGLLS